MYVCAGASSRCPGVSNRFLLTRAVLSVGRSQRLIKINKSGLGVCTYRERALNFDDEGFRNAFVIGAIQRMFHRN